MVEDCMLARLWIKLEHGPKCIGSATGASAVKSTVTSLNKFRIYKLSIWIVVGELTQYFKVVPIGSHAKKATGICISSGLAGSVKHSIRSFEDWSPRLCTIRLATIKTAENG